MTIKRISEISQNPHIQELLRSLDTNHDQQIDTDEVDFDQDGFLDLTSTSNVWSIDERNEIQNSLFRQGLIRFRAIERLELAGSPGAGSVVFIRQIHDRPEITNELRVPIGNYQFGIMLYLMSHNATHIFAEGLDEDIPNNPQVSTVDLSDLIMATSHNQLSDQFYISLTRGSAGRLYGDCFSTDVYLHRTVEPEEERAVSAIINSFWSSGTRQEHYRMAVRESLATTQVMHFLRDHPDETAYLIYGGAHEFSDNFSSYPETPRLISVDFPDHERQVQRTITKMDWMDWVKIAFRSQPVTSSLALLSIAYTLYLNGRPIYNRIFGKQNQNTKPPDDQDPPSTSGSAATIPSAPPLAPGNSNNSHDRNLLEGLGISAGLATVGTAVIHYGPQIVNFSRVAGPVALRALVLGLMFMGG